MATAVKAKGKAPQISTRQLDKAHDLIEAVRKASTDSKRDDAIILAVDYVTELPFAGLPEDLSTFVADAIGNVGALVKARENAVKGTDDRLAELDQQLASTKAQRDQQAMAEREAKAAAMRVAHWTTKVAKLATVQELADRWGYSRGRVSQMVNSYILSKKLGSVTTPSLATVDALKSNDSAIVTDVTKRTGSDKVATVAGLKTAVEAVKAEQRAARSGRTPATPDGPTVEAHKIGKRLAALLDLLVKSHERIADVGDVPGERIAQEVKRAVDTYLKAGPIQAAEAKMQADGRAAKAS